MFGLTAHVQLSGSGRVLDCKLLQLCRHTLYAYDPQLIVGCHKFVKFDVCVSLLLGKAYCV